MTKAGACVLGIATAMVCCSTAAEPANVSHGDVFPTAAIEAFSQFANVVDDGEALYLDSVEAITRISFVDPKPVTLVKFGGREGPGSIAINSRHLYFRDEGYVVARMPKAGGPKETVGALSGTGIFPGLLSVDDRVLYVGQYSGTGDIFLIDATTLQAKDVVHSPSLPQAAEIDARAYYWVDASGMTHRRSTTDGAETILERLPTAAVPTMTQDDAYLYVYDQVAGLRRISKEAGVTTKLADVQIGSYDEPIRLAVDERWVYWISIAEKVFRAPIVGGPIELVAAPAEPVRFGKEKFCRGLVVHDGFVYWCAGSENTIRRIRK